MYMANTGDAADGQHGAIGSWFWWAYPANGGDTGGMVEADWKTVNWNKVRSKMKYVMLQGTRDTCKCVDACYQLKFS